MTIAPDHNDAARDDLELAQLTDARTAYFAVAMSFQDLLARLRERQPVDGQELLREIAGVIKQLRQDERMLLCLANAPYLQVVRMARQPLLAIIVVHGLNTMIYSLKLSFILGVPEKRLIHLAMAALCRHLGLLAVTEQALNRFVEGTNHAAELIDCEQHASEYLQLIQMPAADLELIAELMVMARDHEPKTPPPSNLHEVMRQYAMVIRVCGTFERLTHQRAAGEMLTPVDAMKKMCGEMKNYFHPEIIRLFFNHFSIYPFGSLVKLNSRETAKVVGLNLGFIMRPVVCLVLDKDGQEMLDPIRLNLRDHPNLYIKHAVMDDVLTERFLNLF